MMENLPRIMVAPTGARRTKADHPALPMTIEETVRSALACRKAGAGALHAHTRDSDGAHVLDVGMSRELLAEMRRAVPDMAVQITTEAVGRYTAAEQRSFALALRAPAISVALREMLSDGEITEAGRFYHEMEDRGTAVQHIVFDAEEAARLVQHAATGLIPSPRLQVLLVLGRYSDGQIATPADLPAPLAELERLETPLDWAVCAFGPQETACLAAAIAVGGKARVGFENNFYNADGTRAADNAERVAEIAALFPAD